eukprot:jgi/Psemu1/8020/gm1.8020_g
MAVHALGNGWLSRYRELVNFIIDQGGTSFTSNDFQIHLANLGIKAKLNTNPPQTLQQATDIIDSIFTSTQFAVRSTIHKTFGMMPGSLILTTRTMGKVPSTTTGVLATLEAVTTKQGFKNSQPGQKGKPKAGTKKFHGHDQKEGKGIILWANRGGSKYVPDVGVSITRLKRLSQMDFALDPLIEADYSVKIGEDKTGKPIYEPDPIKKKVAEQMQEEELKIKVKQYTTYCSNMQKIFALDNKMKDTLWSNDNFDKLESSHCVVKLKTKVHSEINLFWAFRKLVCCRQQSGNLSKYYNSATDTFEVFKSLGGSVTYKKTITHELKQGLHQISTYAEYLALLDDDAKKTAIVAGAEQSFLAAILIEGCDEETNTLMEMLANQYTLEMLQQFKGTKTPVSKKPKPNKTDKESTTFVNKGEDPSSRQLLMVAAISSHDDQQSSGTIKTRTYWEIHDVEFDTMVKLDSTDASPNTCSTATTTPTYCSYKEDDISTVTGRIPNLVPQTATDDDSCSTATNVSFPQAGQPTYNGHDPTTIGPTTQSS